MSHLSDDRQLPVRRPVPHTGPVRHRPGAGVVAVALAALAGTLLSSPPAASAPSSACPAPYPVDQVRPGQQVRGLSVHEGTEPSAFTGEVLGVVRDGIAPGLDMVMARLESPEIDRVGGIWQGMSGSPVYAADGRLVGAVAYSLALGPSKVAGITPAAEMYRMFEDRPRTARMGRPRDKVTIPRPMHRSLVDSATAARSAARAGLVRLPVPLSVSGMVDAARLGRARTVLGLKGAAVAVHHGGAVGDANVEIPVVAGGNMAASISYGDVSTVGVGTATAVCGDEVVGFGHPMGFTGPSRMALHGADAVLVQDDPVGSPFKLANAGAPVGRVSQDRLGGLLGQQRRWKVPNAAEVTSYVAVPGDRQRTGTTHVNVPEAVPEIAALHLLADQDRVFDGMGGGSASVGWVVTGVRSDGRSFRLERRDRYASRADLSSEPFFDLLDQLTSVHEARGGRLHVKHVRTSSTMTRRYEAYTVAGARIRANGRWRPLRADRTVMLRAGTVRRVRVRLSSQQLPATTVVLRLTVPRRTGGNSGVLDLAGGNAYLPRDEELDGFAGGLDGASPAGAGAARGSGDVLRQLRRLPRNDHVIADLVLFGNDGTTLRRSARSLTGAVVDGGLSVPVQVLKRR